MIQIRPEPGAKERPSQVVVETLQRSTCAGPVHTFHAHPFSRGQENPEQDAMDLNIYSHIFRRYHWGSRPVKKTTFELVWACFWAFTRLPTRGPHSDSRTSACRRDGGSSTDPCPARHRRAKNAEPKSGRHLAASTSRGRPQIHFRRRRSSVVPARQERNAPMIEPNTARLLLVQLSRQSRRLPRWPPLTARRPPLPVHMLRLKKARV